MHSRNECLKVLRERYSKAKTKWEKSQILDEYCRNTGQARKYAIRKIQPGVNLGPKVRRKRKEGYDGQVRAPLVKVWEIFDYPCGQRLKPPLEVEVDRLREFGELRVSDEVASKLKRMSSATIDRKLKHQREVLHLLRSKGGAKPGSLLKQKIPIRLTEWDTSQVCYVEADMVVQGVKQVDIDTVKSYAQDLRGLLEESDFTERKAFLRSFIKRIEVNKEQITIHYHLPLPQGDKERVTLEVLPIDTLGGAGGIRTPYLLTASQTFSQLNYSPTTK